MDLGAFYRAYYFLYFYTKESFQAHYVSDILVSLRQKKYKKEKEIRTDREKERKVEREREREKDRDREREIEIER